jgi:hypothetical protein
MRADLIGIEDDYHLMIRHYSRPRNKRMQAFCKLYRPAEMNTVAGDLMNVLTPTPQPNPFMPQLTQHRDSFEQRGILVEEVNTLRAFPPEAPAEHVFVQNLVVRRWLPAAVEPLP